MRGMRESALVHCYDARRVGERLVGIDNNQDDTVINRLDKVSSLVIYTLSVHARAFDGGMAKPSASCKVKSGALRANVGDISSQELGSRPGKESARKTSSRSSGTGLNGDSVDAP